MTEEKLHPLANKKKPSKVEEAKANGHALRGTIKEVLASDAPNFDHDDMQLLKFHGIYQQDDRDVRDANKALGGDKEHMFMIRVKVPGGAITADQYLTMDKIGEKLTWTHSLRLTTRQCFQLHGVFKETLKPSIKEAYDALLDAISGCGDIPRNVMASPAPFANAKYRAMDQLANELSAGMAPTSKAYFEIWLDEEKVASSEEEKDPLYTDTYLPRKFKTGLAFPEDNAVDAHSQDLGIVAITDDSGEIIGANFLVGGGLGMTHKKADTYARLGSELGFIDRENIVEAARIVVSIFRDYGDRTDRKHARLKYVVEEEGIENVRAEFQRRASFELKPWHDIQPLAHKDWLGTHEQGDGNYFYGLFIQNGRIIDNDRFRLKTCIRRIVEGLKPKVILTPNQNLVFGDLTEDGVKALKRALKAFNIPDVDEEGQMTWVQRGSMACPALPTCGLALTESERIFPDVVETLEEEFIAAGVENEPIAIRMTGCPNGCARPYTADIGLVGHKPGHYDLFLGGTHNGTCMAELYEENVPQEELTARLRPMLKAWKAGKQDGESFGEYYRRELTTNKHSYLVTGDRDNGAKPTVDEKLVSLNVLA